MTTRNTISTNRSIIRNTFYIQLTAFILLSLSSSVGSMIDGVVIGQFLGVDSIAAFGIINPLMIAFSIIGAVVVAGARNRFTRLLGAGKTEQAKKVFSLACVLSAGFAAALMLFLIVFSAPVTSALGASRNNAELLPQARGYLIGISFGLPAMNLVRVLNGFMPLDNDRNLPVISSIALTISDIVMDLAAVLIFHGGTFEMGVATSVSYYVALVVLLTHFRKKEAFLRFTFRGLPWNETAEILGKGMPSGVCRLGNTVRCYAIGMPINGLNLIYLNYFQGIGKSRLASISGFICESGFLILSAAAMMPSFGADAVWLAYPISQLLVMCYYGIVVAVESRRIKIHREGLWNRVLLLPDTFDVLDHDKLDVTVTKMEDVMALTDSIWKFCDEHGCDTTRRNHLALSVEELAGNMIQHGFTDGRPHCIEARVLKKGDRYYVRFRNDCLIFDPLKQIRLLSDEDPTYHIGLRMIAGLARDIRYTCVLKLNNILVKI